MVDDKPQFTGPMSGYDDDDKEVGQYVPQTPPPRSRRHLTQQALLQIGVPPLFIKRSLRTDKYGAAVNEWMATTGWVQIRKGTNWIFDVRHKDALDVFPLLTTALYAHNKDCRLTRLDHLVRLISTRNYKSLDWLCKMPVLLIEDFFEPSKGPRDCPFPIYHRRQVESFLLDRVTDRRSTIMQIYNPYGLLLNHIDWWRSSVFEKIAPDRLIVGEISVKQVQDYAAK